MDLCKVLIIDDEPLILKSTALILKYHQFEVVTAINGSEGLLIAEQSLPDIILLDIMMPGLNGWDVLHMLKKNPKTTKIPVVIFSAKEFSFEETQCVASLFAEIVTKPFDPDLLASLIHKIIGK